MQPEGSTDNIMLALRERAKELHCLYNVLELMNRADLTLQEVCEALLVVLPPGWQFPDACFARVTLDGVVHEPPRALRTPWVQKADLVVHGHAIGSIEVYYTQEMPESAEGPFLAEERKLIDTIAERIGHYLGQRRLQGAIREWQAAAREVQALESTLIFAAPGGANASFAKERVKRIAELAPGLVRELDAVYFRLSGQKRLPSPILTAEERDMASRVPVNVESLDEYFKKRGFSTAWPGLHPIMARECYGFVDGKRSFLDIYRAVHAEALSAGEFYYGTVTPDSVKGLLDEAVEKGVLKLK